jgi:hypothetical protein
LQIRQENGDGFDEIVDRLRGIVAEGIYHVYTWIFQVSAMQNNVSQCLMAPQERASSQ